jgi:hypothetical protein
MPVWRFQLQGPESFASQLKRLARGDVRTATPEGHPE